MEASNQDLPLLRSADGKPALCLVTGATGYIGGRLIVELLKHGYRVRILARNPERLKYHPWIDQVEVAEGDAQDRTALERALAGVDVAYYLLHALMSKDNFESQERTMAESAWLRIQPIIVESLWNAARSDCIPTGSST